MPSRCRVEVTLLSRERRAPAPDARDARAQVIVVQRTALGTSRATRSGLRLAMERQRQRARSWMTGPAREVEPGYSRALDTTFGHPYPDRSRSGAWFPNPAQLNDGPPRKRRAVRFHGGEGEPVLILPTRGRVGGCRAWAWLVRRRPCASDRAVSDR